MSFKHYMKSTRVMLPVVFEEFEVAYIFFAIFFLFIIIVNLHKANFSKSLGGGSCCIKGDFQICNSVPWNLEEKLLFKDEIFVQK